MDRFDKATRSRVMASVRSKHTGPELAVRRLAHRDGYRFRLHRRGLPGTPDLVFARFRTVVLVHGCFWHGHANCGAARLPRTNAEFWAAKIDRNQERDARNEALLRELGWSVLTIWECELRDPPSVVARLRSALPRADRSIASVDQSAIEANS